MLTDDGAVTIVRLRGEACELTVTLHPSDSAQSLALSKPRPPFLFAVERLSLQSCAGVAASSAAAELSFPVTTLGSSCTRVLVLGNPSPVPLPYQWLLPQNDAYSSLTPVFHVYPPSGTLQAYDSREVVATFTPHAADVYHHHAQLLINGALPEAGGVGEGRGRGGGGGEDISVAEVRLLGEGRLGRLLVDVVKGGEAEGEGEGERDGEGRGGYVWRLVVDEWSERRLRVRNECEVALEYSVECVARGVGERPPHVRVQLWPGQGRVRPGGEVELSCNVEVEGEGKVEVLVDVVAWPGGQRTTCCLTGVATAQHSAPLIEAVEAVEGASAP